MLIGYARVSSYEQNLDLQVDALKKDGCEKIFTDKMRGIKEARNGLDDSLAYMRAGDTLVVWRLDRLGRTLKHLIDLLTSLDKQQVGFKSLTESIDTTTSTRKLVFHIFAALAEFERGLIRERTIAGIEAARARGKIGGRPKAMTLKQSRMAKDLYVDKNNSVSEICQMFQVSKATLYRYMKTVPEAM